METPMAISGYLGWFLVILLGYPFALVALQVAIYDKRFRRKVTIWFNLSCFVLIAGLIVMHMQTEVIFGKELLDAWYARNPKT